MSSCLPSFGFCSCLYEVDTQKPGISGLVSSSYSKPHLTSLRQELTDIFVCGDCSRVFTRGNIDNLFWVCTSKNPFSRKKERIWWVTVVKSCGEIKLVIIPFHPDQISFYLDKLNLNNFLHFQNKKIYIL